MKAFITGIAGQDGSYLSEYLLKIGYEVHGIIRRNSTPENQENRIAHLDGKVKTYYGDLLDQGSLERLLSDIQPDEIYNLAAQSHVRISFDVPQFTAQVNALGVLNILEAYRRACPKARFYQASSSEMFGNSVDEDGFQRLSTPMVPVSPYGVSKLFGYNMVRSYRESYGLHAKSGILFNHESPRRGSNFVTNKVVKGAVKIYYGQIDSIALGNLDASRDWGHSKDYVRAMHMINNFDSATEYIVATGESRSVREMCEYVFGKLKLDYQKHVTVDERFYRPNELKYLRGYSYMRAFGWIPEYTFESMMDEMIEYWLNELK